MNISEENKRLARSTCGAMAYANMKVCIHKLFGDPSGDKNGCAPLVKSEPVFHSHHSEDVNYASGYRVEDGVVKDEVEEDVVITYLIVFNKMDSILEGILLIGMEIY